MMEAQEISGLVLLDKPQGFTSFKAAAAMRRIYGTKRVGHTGTLDPMATGVLPILIGKATRLCSLVLEADKRYTATVRLGVTTDSLDITGEVINLCKPQVTDEQLSHAIKHFLGEYDQIPPMFSAIKKNGVRLYELARKGEQIEREPRRVCIRGINLLKRSGDDFIIDVLCSKGTYIRSLADDIGRFLGCGACLVALRRTKTAQFEIGSCSTLEEIENAPEKHLLSPEIAVSHLREVYLSEGQKTRFANGGDISLDRVRFVPKFDGELVRMKHGDRFLGHAEYKSEKGSFVVKCVLER